MREELLHELDRLNVKYRTTKDDFIYYKLMDTGEFIRTFFLN